MLEGIKRIFGGRPEQEVHYGKKGSWPGTDDPWDDSLSP